MRIVVYLLAGLLLLGCKARKSYTDSFRQNPPVPVQTVGNNPDTLQEEIVEEQITVKEEQVKLTHGSDMMRYCIILGSFVNELNAVDLRATLMKSGFPRSSIMQNQEGMFRVSAVCYDNEVQARTELLKIRHQYPQYADAWLLITK